MKSVVAILFLSVLQFSPGDEIVDRTMKFAESEELGYALYLPESHESGEARPLILALHYGWSGSNDRAPDGYGKQYMEVLVLPAFRELGAVIVAPDCPASSWNDPTSETALLALVDHITAQYKIDTEKIVITGFSLGAAGTWFMAAQHPGRFSAAIPVAGFPMTRVAADSRVYRKQINAVLADPLKACTIPGIPVFAIHGRNDEVIPHDPVVQTFQILRDAGADIEYFTVEGISHYQTGEYVDWLNAAIPWLKKQWSH